ncbi:AbrB/MazE/SpoVT family DNA-binding domain-containing protein [Mangrovicella endophytica]|uniref:AbrB/MazE/SpoVT family DNA-binding domain-containing protein n=1 Tax=Mangrovicella endophytica TaxID=2066697 RepID=UPI000C9E45DB|nr:antitoxin [Mangrovicella endophytica]
MATSRLRKVGGSVMLAIPPALLEQAKLGASSLVDISLDEASGSLSVRPARRRYSLAELLAESEPAGEMPDEDRLWLDSPAVGSEDI